MKLDIISYQIGMINCFVEMVACGVKKMAISPPINPKNYKKISEFSDMIVKEFGVQSYLEKKLLITDLQTAEFTKGKWSILYYENDKILKKYLELKEKKENLELHGLYDSKSRRQISHEFMQLLSYPEEKIKEKLSQNSPKDPFLLSFKVE